MRAIQSRSTFAIVILAASATAQAPLVWRRLPQAGELSCEMAFDSFRQRFVLQGSRTWEWDGADWRERRTANHPGPFTTMNLAFDMARGRTVLFGGRANGSNTAICELWDYDGLEWTRRSVVGGPSGRWAQAMAYDSLRLRVVVFGGVNGSGSRLGDTWTWDGAVWQAISGVGPTPGGAAMAFHQPTGRMVLFGTSPSGTLGETWTFDGSSWRFELPATRPAVRSGYHLCEDIAHGVVRMIGGDITAWQWNGSDWSPGPAPARLRAWPAIASDHSGRTLLHGCQEITGTFTPYALSDTWLLQSGSWTRLHDTGPQSAVDITLTSGLGGTALCTSLASDRRTYLWSNGEWSESVGARLPPLFGARACHDPLRARFVMFGGGSANSFMSVSPSPTASLFEYDGVSWTPNAAPGPSPRSKSSLAFDSTNGEVLLFGGSTGSSSLADTWLWNGSRWRLAATAGPAARSCAAAAADTAHLAVVLFGGDNNGSVLDDTWLWSGSSWLQVVPTVHPPRRYDAGFDYDPARGRAVLVGGKSSGTSTYSDLWEWDGAAWTQRSGGIAESLFLTQNAATAAAGNGMVRVVGTDFWYGTVAAAAVDTLPAGCGTPPPLLAAFGEPVLGSTTFAVELHRAAAGAPFAVGVGLPAQVALGAGCTLQLQTIEYAAVGLVTPSGRAVVALPVPSTPALRGLAAAVQGGVVQPTAPLGFVLTNGLLAHVGD